MTIYRPNPGKITYNTHWDLTPKRQAALTRLAELGVNVFSSISTHNFTLLIPHDLASPLYIEIGYLVAQLGDETFPEGCETLSEVPSEVLPANVRKVVPVYFVDSHPHGLKYRVTPHHESD